MSITRLAPLVLAAAIISPALAAAPIALTFPAPASNSVVKSNYFGLSIELSFYNVYCAFIHLFHFNMLNTSQLAMTPILSHNPFSITLVPFAITLVVSPFACVSVSPYSSMCCCKV